MKAYKREECLPATIRRFLSQTADAQPLRIPLSAYQIKSVYPQHSLQPKYNHVRQRELKAVRWVMIPSYCREETRLNVSASIWVKDHQIIVLEYEL